MKSLILRTSILTALVSLTAASPGMAADPNFLEADVDVLYSMSEEQPGSVLGWVADPIGDINNDGRPDFITSAPWYVDNGNVVGKAYVFSGADGVELNSIVGVPGERLGWSATLAGDVNNDGTNDYVVGSRARTMVFSGADHSLIHEWSAAGIAFGFDSNTAGDLNGDGYDDVLVGAPFAGDNGPVSGTVYAYSGVDGSVLWTFSGESGWVAGLGVGPVGDVNNDGVPDVVVAAPGGNANHKGAAFVLSGTDGGILLELNPKTSSVGKYGASTFGVYHCHGAGDINADGIPDIYVGDYNAKGGQHNPNGTNSVGSGLGRAHIFSGADGSILDRIEGENFGDGMGPGRGIADVDGDGHDDIFVAAWAFGPHDSGKGYLISGRSGEVIRTMTGVNDYEYVGVDAMAVGDVNGDSLTDFVLTGWGTLHLVLGN